MESGDENQPYLNFFLMYIIGDTQGLRLGAREVEKKMSLMMRP
jgi:hypothetical protein